jgi:mannose-6-phosphate isomerase-like protein (cupin superfamily)
MSLKGFRTRLENVPKVITPNGIGLQIPVHAEVTGPSQEAPVSLFVITFPPGVASPPHNHESDEYEYVLSGTGKLDSGDEKGIPLVPNTIAYNPKGIMHQIKNTGSEPLTVLKVHVPPVTPHGPDDIFTTQAIEAAKEAFKAE